MADQELQGLAGAGGDRSRRDLIPLLVLGGPTATGKTDMALRVAETVGGEIVSADAFQIYRGMAIGTAQPTAADRKRAPFHLIAELDPNQPFTVADYQRRAEEALADIWTRGRLPILCGGTGLYLRAVLRHFEIPPTDPQAQREIRARLRQEAAEQGLGALYRRLQQLDPTAAARIAPQDERRLVRALEVWELTGRPFSEVAAVDRVPRLRYNAWTYVLTCPRALLYQRIGGRVEGMLAAGWLAEAQALAEAGLSPALPALRALGYAALFGVLRGETSLAQAAEQIRRETRNYAKRQLTWLRREWGFTWMTWSTPAEYDAFARHLISVAQASCLGR
jgi:tRNA dimethylallyltransferase